MARNRLHIRCSRHKMHPLWTHHLCMAAAYADENEKGMSLPTSGSSWILFLIGTPSSLLLVHSAGMASSPFVTQGEYVPTAAMADVDTAVTFSCETTGVGTPPCCLWPNWLPQKGSRRLCVGAIAWRNARKNGSDNQCRLMLSSLATTSISYIVQIA
jgi:hypothetical protein